MQSIKVFLLCAVLFSVTNFIRPVDSGCTNRPNNNDDTTNTTLPNDGDEHSSVSEFFHNVGCSLRSGAKKVKESVESGINFVKSRVQSITDGDDADGNNNNNITNINNNSTDDEEQAVVLEDGGFDDAKSSPIIDVRTGDQKKNLNQAASPQRVKPLDKSSASDGRSADDSDELDDDRIIFVDSDSMNANQFSSALPAPNVNISLDDRTALSAPGTCGRPGEIKDTDGICRDPTKLHFSS